MPKFIKLLNLREKGKYAYIKNMLSKLQCFLISTFRLEGAEKELNQVMGLLREKQRQLADVEAMIASLEAKFNEAVSEKQELVNNIELTSNRLNRAGRLNVALGDEQIRWEESVKVNNI